MRCHRSIAASLLTLSLVACAGYRPDDQRLGAIRSEVRQAQANPAITRYAPVQLREANQALAMAEKADNNAEFEHWAFITRNRVELAQARSQAQAARDERTNLAQQMQIESARQPSMPTTVTLSEVLFETGGSQLKAGASTRLNQIAEQLRANPDLSVTVLGHTDSTGSADTNRMLSQERAEAVRQFLASAGIDPRRITAQGMGESLPVASNDTAAGRQQNRRVEIQLSQMPDSR